MNTKLTLNLDKDIIEQTKRYAQTQRQSLSGLVENYFRFLLEQEQTPAFLEISSTVRELSGIIQLDNQTDIHEEYTDYLLKKYR
ncbi:hypothetical protein CSA56_03205 [candidate division KSB3 bacterium]|uniref:Antitoxin n=1 Tax=candidate division KSB3 bacterium TaxID=2044937 RepID=A0A2G6KJ26_9BACT|nr:MAG: hypothetical protein CSA56_03205 [candidate division KSB3 bacterium]